MEALSFEWLLAIGIILIGFEALLFSFFLFPIGLGFLIVSFLQFAIFDFENFYKQVATALILGLILLILFKKRFIKLVNKNSSIEEHRIHTKGVGTVNGKQIKFEGTYWNTDNDLSSLSDGERVNIEIVKNKAVIKS